MYKKHVFVCENIRESNQKKSCGQVGTQLRKLLKKEIINKKLNNKIRINRSGCLGKCAQGPCIVVYPKGRWYLNTKLEEYEEIINIKKN